MKRRLCSHGLLSILHTRDEDVRQIADGNMDMNWSIAVLVPSFIRTGFPLAAAS